VSVKILRLRAQNDTFFIRIACQNVANPPCSVRLRDYGAGCCRLGAEDDGS
jgi:hypothetical protein